MALFQKTVTQKRRDKDYNKTLLLNTKKLTTYYPDSDDKIIFYYADVMDRKVKPVEYHADESFDTFITHVRGEEAKEADTGLKHISLTAESKGVNEETFERKIGFYEDHFVKGIADPDNSNKSFIWIADGAFGATQYKVDASLSEIEEEASGSVSV